MTSTVFGGILTVHSLAVLISLFAVGSLVFVAIILVSKYYRRREEEQGDQRDDLDSSMIDDGDATLNNYQRLSGDLSEEDEDLLMC